MNGMNDVKNTFIRNSDVHRYNTTHKSNLRSLKLSTSKGILRFNCNFITHWNMSDEDTKQLSCPSFSNSQFIDFLDFLDIDESFYFLNL